MSEYLKHMDREWKVLGWPTEVAEEPEDKDSPEHEKWIKSWPQANMYQHMKDLLEVFSEEGHSGSSAPYAVNLFSKLALFKPLSPLTGANEEWDAAYSSGKDSVQQNKRCTHVFRNVRTGEAYDIYAVIFRDKNGVTYTDNESSKPVSFPYTPCSKFIDKDSGVDE